MHNVMLKKKQSVIKEHVLIPPHKKISETEKKTLFKTYGITERELPKIRVSDPGIVDLGVAEGDVVKIVRKSPTAGETVFYREVINE